jgi:hypothetical protein
MLAGGSPRASVGQSLALGIGTLRPTLCAARPAADHPADASEKARGQDDRPSRAEGHLVRGKAVHVHGLAVSMARATDPALDSREYRGTSGPPCAVGDPSALPGGGRRVPDPAAIVPVLDAEVIDQVPAAPDTGRARRALGRPLRRDPGLRGSRSSTGFSRLPQGLGLGASPRRLESSPQGLGSGSV